MSLLFRSSQYSMVAGAGRENGMEAPMHENPEWEKARQALASISKAGAAGSSSKASSNGPVASAQVRRVAGEGNAWSSLGSQDQGAPKTFAEPQMGEQGLFPQRAQGTMWESSLRRGTCPGSPRCPEFMGRGCGSLERGRPSCVLRN